MNWRTLLPLGLESDSSATSEGFARCSESSKWLRVLGLPSISAIVGSTIVGSSAPSLRTRFAGALWVDRRAFAKPSASFPGRMAAPAPHLEPRPFPRTAALLLRRASLFSLRRHVGTARQKGPTRAVTSPTPPGLQKALMMPAEQKLLGSALPTSVEVKLVSR